MTMNILSLSSQEAQFLTHMSAMGREVFSTADAQTYWSSQSKAAQMLGRLVKKGWLKRLSRGTYLVVPLAAGPDRQWTESAFVIASHLVAPAAIAYWSALHYWNMTEQLPHTVFVQTTNRKLPMNIMGMRFQFVTVLESRFFGVINRSQDGKLFQITNREKTLLDAAARPDLSGGVTQLIQALQESYREIDWLRLEDYLDAWGGGVVVKRLGYLLEILALPIPDLNVRLGKWRDMLSKGVSPLEPGAGDTGPIVTRWRIRVNMNLNTLKQQNDK